MITQVFIFTFTVVVAPSRSTVGKSVGKTLNLQACEVTRSSSQIWSGEVAVPAIISLSRSDFIEKVFEFILSVISFAVLV